MIYREGVFNEEAVFGRVVKNPEPTADVLKEFKTAAQSFVDTCEADPSRRVESDEIQKHVAWLKELLA